jgi:hypothetical protein
LPSTGVRRAALDHQVADSPAAEVAEHALGRCLAVPDLH